MEWIDPEKTENVKECNKYILFSGQYAHKTGIWDVIPNKNIEMIDEKEWEMFGVGYENDEYYWGMPVEGLGMVHCMCPKENCRELTKKERKYWSGKTMGMYGSHSGKLSYTFKLGEM